MQVDAFLLASAAVAALFAATHLFGARMTFLSTTPRSVWLSIAGGVSVAYVFVHLLPELAEHQERVSEHIEGRTGLLAAIENHIYLGALAGLALFYGLDRLARCSAREEKEAGRAERPPRGIFWTHLLSFAAYNLLVGYLLLHREETGLLALGLYGVAMALHFLVNDQGLREHHGRAYDREGRWLLGMAAVAGWVIGLFVEIPAGYISGLFALLAGGIVLNVLKEELPEDRDSRFWAFAGGAAGYAALLLAVT